MQIIPLDRGIKSEYNKYTRGRNGFDGDDKGLGASSGAVPL